MQKQTKNLKTKFKFSLSGKTTLKYNFMLDSGQGVISSITPCLGFPILSYLAGLHNAADKYMYM